MSPDARRTRRPRERQFEMSDNLSLARSRPETRRRSRRPTSLWPFRGDWSFNPYWGFLMIVGVSLATLRLDHFLRLTLLWAMLLALVLLYAEGGRLKAEYSLLNLVRGAVVGIVVALPFTLFARDFFYATASWLYGVTDLQVLLERAVFIVPLLEESYFRGAVQQERGLVEGAALFGLAQALYFISAAHIYPAVILAVVLGMFVLGLLYGYLYQRYGLTASIACHVAVNFVLFVVPVLAARIAQWLA